MSNMNEEIPLSGTCVPDAGTRSYASPVSPQSQEQMAWYPMYVTYSREVQVRDALDKKSVKNFLPMAHLRLFQPHPTARAEDVQSRLHPHAVHDHQAP